MNVFETGQYKSIVECLKQSKLSGQLDLIEK